MSDNTFVSLPDFLYGASMRAGVHALSRYCKIRHNVTTQNFEMQIHLRRPPSRVCTRQQDTFSNREVNGWPTTVAILLPRVCRKEGTRCVEEGRSVVHS